MKTQVKKTIKIIAITLLSLVLLVAAAITFVIHVVFTPEKLTPIVVRVANQTLDAKLDMKSVELTFFSTFPRFGLKLTDGTLVSKAINDTLWQKTDSLLSFKKCVVVVNPIDYLEKQRISLYYLSLDSISAYAHINKEGKANWDIVKLDTTTTEAESDTAKMQLDAINIRNVFVRHANLTFDDRATQVYADLQDANLHLKASLQRDRTLLALDFDNRNLIFWQEGNLLARRIRTKLSTQLKLDRPTRTLTLKDARITVNGTELDVQGTLRGDSVQRALDMDLRYGLHAPSLTRILRMIPESVVKRGDVKAKGSVQVEGTLKGLYNKEQMPVATLTVKIDSASAQYAGLPYGIDNFTADFHGVLDLMKREPSYADLKILHFEGAHTDILADAKIQDLLGDPDITLNTKSTVDLTALSQTFPLQPGVSLEGKLDADIRLRCRLSTIKKRDLGRLRIGGKLEMSDMALRDTAHKFNFTGDASFAFVGKDWLAARAEVRQLKLISPRLNASVEKGNAKIKSTNPQDTTQIVRMDCEVNLNRLQASLGDSLKVFSMATKGTVKLQPGDRNPSKPKIGLSLETDTFFCKMGDIRVGMDKAGFGVSAEKLRDSLWIPKGIIGFRFMKLQVPQMALPIYMNKTSVTVGNHQIALRNATMRIGRSDLTASGAVHDLYGAMKRGKMLRANLEISSNNLNCNQLIRAMSFPEDTVGIESETETAADTTGTNLSLFIIPKNIDFELQTNLKRVRYGKMLFENVRGAVDVRNQAVHLKNLSMIGLGAQMKTVMVYHTARHDQGYVGFDFRLHNVNIGKLIDFIPSLDTVVPMLRSFEGMVDFDVAAETVLDSCLNIRIPTLRSAMHVKGDSLVLMDGETFAEISKMLLFKNKKRNLFDHIEANITVQDGNVTIYPFLVEIDRYKAAVGGTQGLDLNFDYHISVLKSPIPLVKLGINITGNLDDMKIRLGKAKYKDAVTPVAIRAVDSTRINMGRQIVRDFQQLMQRVNERNEE